MSDDTLARWLQHLAGEIGGQVVIDGERYELRPTSSKYAAVTGSQEALVISPSPETAKAWRVRLRYIEKAAAQAILAGPVGFSCSLTGQGDEQSEDVPSIVIRLAFGLSLSAGASCYRRYTAYFLPEQGCSAFLEGEDRLFETPIDLQALDLKAPHLSSSLESLLALAGKIEDEYLNTSQVAEQIGTLNQLLASELRALNRFYTPGRGQDAHALGRLDPRLRGEDRLDAEYTNKAQDIIEKYRVRVLFRPLTLGMVSCQVGISDGKKGTSISMPFVVKHLLANKS